MLAVSVAPSSENGCSSHAKQSVNISTLFKVKSQ